jgi:tripartite-type tricarboxylate transporter receptor subunit TctC
MLVPKATPKAVVDKINKDVVASIKSKDIEAKMKAQFVIPVTDTPAAFDKIIASETANLTKVFKEAGI